ncbi:MAG: hypothetical protein ABTQ32_31310 [Myxococcaceae bacterium]
MLFSCLVSVLVGQTAPAPAVEVEPAPVLAPAPPVEPESFLNADQRSALGFGIGASAIGIGAGLGAWFDREGTFGRISAITAGTLGTAMLVGGVAMLIAAAVIPKAPRGSTVSGVVEEVIGGVGRAVSIGVIGIIAAGVGLVGGAIMSALVSAPPGSQRGVLGVAGGSAMLATSIALVAVSFQ